MSAHQHLCGLDRPPQEREYNEKGKSLSRAQSQCVVEEDHPLITMKGKSPEEETKRPQHPKGQKGSTPDESTQWSGGGKRDKGLRDIEVTCDVSRICFCGESSR